VLATVLTVILVVFALMIAFVFIGGLFSAVKGGMDTLAHAHWCQEYAYGKWWWKWNLPAERRRRGDKAPKESWWGLYYYVGILASSVILGLVSRL
jgi:hypothetical protein